MNHLDVHREGGLIVLSVAGLETRMDESHARSFAAAVLRLADATAEWKISDRSVPV